MKYLLAVVLISLCSCATLDEFLATGGDEVATQVARDAGGSVAGPVGGVGAAALVGLGIYLYRKYRPGAKKA